VPLIGAGIGLTLLVIAVATLPARPTATPAERPTLSEAEALTIVAHEMRAGDAAARVMTEGQTRFDDGTWHITVRGAHFHFSQRNRIVVAEDLPATQLEYAAP
jgi:hypothetical protein